VLLDRIVITGTLPEIAHAEAMARYLGIRGMRLFDYPRWAEPLREQLRTHAERLAAEAGLEIEFIRHYKNSLHMNFQEWQPMATPGQFIGALRCAQR